MTNNTALPEFMIARGPMFAGKTSWLLMQLERFKYQGKKIAVFKPMMDNRYSEGEIVSHGGWKAASILINEGEDILRYLSESDTVYDVVAVDEQFMIPGSAEALIWLYQSGFTIIVSTLDFNALAKPYKEVEKILPWATKNELCVAVCTVCHRDARYTHKKQLTDEENASSDWVTVGGAELYEPRCALHHPYIMNDVFHSKVSNHD